MRKYLIIIGIPLLFFLAGFSSCEKNHAPEIIEISYSPLSGTGGTVYTLTVGAVDRDSDPLRYLWTAEDGEFLDGSTSAQAKWQAPVLMTSQAYSIKLSVSDGEESISQNVQLQVGKTETGSISGNVFFAGCKIPISGVSIQLSDKNATSELDGGYTFEDVPVGTYTLEAAKSDYDSFSQEITVIKNDTLAVDIALSSQDYTSKVYGTLEDMDGRAIGEAELFILNPDDSESELKSNTGTNGYFELLAVPKGERTIVVKIFGCQVFQSMLNVDSETQFDIQIMEIICIDPDGRSYETVQIGNQTWMAENLAYLPNVSAPSDGTDENLHYYVYGYNGTSISDAKATVIYKSYGVLYNWVAANNACPRNWHLPSVREWETLINYLTNNGYADSNGSVGKSIASTSGWNGSPYWWAVGNNQGSNNSSGFNAFPAGSRNFGGTFNLMRSDALFWSSGAYGSVAGFYWYLSSQSSGVYQSDNYRRFGYSVRCLKN